jgi:hypothetical protein
MEPNATQANIVKCMVCGHRWVGFYLPLPVDQACRIMKNLTCPKCATGANKICVFDGSADSAEVTRE